MTANWAACLLAICFAADGDVKRDGDSRAVGDRPAWAPRFFRADWWKRKSPESPVKPRADESARRPSLTTPSRRRTEQPSANLIISRCRAALHQETGLKDSTIYVDVQGDAVTLTGTVPSVLEKDRAERIARKTEGVGDVRNLLVISNPITNWFQQSAVTLSTPPKPSATQTLRPSNEIVEAPARGKLESPLPVDVDRVAVVADRPRPASPAPKGKVIPSPPSSRSNGTIAPRGSQRVAAVTLGQPELIHVRPGLPVVVTYVVAVPKAQIVADVGSASRIPATIANESRITVAGAAQSTTELPRPGAMPALLPNIEPIVGMPSALAPLRPAAPTVPIATSRKPTNNEPNSAIVDVAAIESVLQSDSRAARLTFQWNNGELTLAGGIATPGDLYDLANKLRDVPGVALVSFGRIRFGY